MRISDWSSDVCSSDLLDVPDLGQAPVDEIDHAAADPANRGDGKLAGPALLRKGNRTQGASARDGGVGVLDPEADRIGVGAVNQVGRLGETLPLGIDDEVDAGPGGPLPPQGDRKRDE